MSLDTAMSAPNAEDARMRRYLPRAQNRETGCNKLSDSERLRVAKARDKVAKMQRQIDRAKAAGDLGKAKRISKTLAQSQALLVAASADARKGERGKKPSLSEVVQRVLSGESRQAVVHNVAKPSGGIRQITAFGVTDRARQIAAAKSYGHLISYHRNQFGVPGKGIKQAVAAVAELIKTGRFTHAQELDISNHFGSVQGEVLRTMFNIPDPIVRDVLTLEGKEDRGEIIYRGRRNNLAIGTNQQGTLPQGACSSSVFANGLLSPVLESFDRLNLPEVAVVNYCDNFLLLGGSIPAIKEAAKNLTRLLKEHPAALFVLVTKTNVRNLSQGINFLGYRFVRQSGRPVVRATTCKLRDFRKDFYRLVNEIGRPSPSLVAAPEIRTSRAARYAISHLSSFRQATYDHSRLCCWVVSKLKHHNSNRDVARLRAHIERKAPSDAEREAANMPGNAAPRKKRRPPRPTDVPRSFRIAGVLDAIGDPMIASAARAHTYRVVEKFLASRNPTAPNGFDLKLRSPLVQERALGLGGAIGRTFV